MKPKVEIVNGRSMVVRDSADAIISALKAQADASTPEATMALQVITQSVSDVANPPSGVTQAERRSAYRFLFEPEQKSNLKVYAEYLGLEVTFVRSMVKKLTHADVLAEFKDTKDPEHEKQHAEAADDIRG